MQIASVVVKAIFHTWKLDMNIIWSSDWLRQAICEACLTDRKQDHIVYELSLSYCTNCMNSSFQMQPLSVGTAFSMKIAHLARETLASIVVKTKCVFGTNYSCLGKLVCWISLTLNVHVNSDLINQHYRVCEFSPYFKTTNNLRAYAKHSLVAELFFAVSCFVLKGNLKKKMKPVSFSIRCISWPLYSYHCKLTQTQTHCIQNINAVMPSRFVL